QSMYVEGEDYTNNLTYSDNDAVSMGSILAAAGWEEANIRVRARGSGTTTAIAPTKANLFADLDELAASISSSDTVLIYFSGHGTYRSSTDTTYFIPYLGISDEASPSLYYSLCVSPAELAAKLEELPTDKVFVILDTCYSGGFVDTGSATDTAPQNYGIFDDGTEPSTVLYALGNFGELLSDNADRYNATPPITISAAGAEELSYENPYYSHGIFTYLLLESAENGDSNNDGYITASESYGYILNRFESVWNSQYYSSIDPVSGLYADYLPRISGGARDLVLFED
ncbi:MAG TPA: caspase family protein, partial [Spirochaetia bacterium]|nr:caspase family protein [Spirochaetia bacterium]